MSIDGKSAKNTGYVPSPEYDVLKARYRKVLDTLDERTDFESVSFAGHDSYVSVENQQWEVTWSHVMSMIGSVIPYQKAVPSSGTEKRTELIDMIAKLVEIAQSSRQSKTLKQDYILLQKKLEESQAKIKEQEEEIKMYRRLKLTERITGVKSRVKAHIDEQTKLIAKMESREKRKRTLERRLNLARVEVDDKKPSRSPQSRKHRKIVITEYSDDEFVPVQRKHVIVETNAKSDKERCLRHVNRLIDTANQIKRDCVKLGNVQYRSCSASPEHVRF